MPHQRDHFFKYTSAQTAALVLESGTFRYAAPPTLNDPFDAQLDLQLGFTLAQLEDAMSQRYLEAINSPAPLANPHNKPFMVLLEMMRANRHRFPSDEELIGEMQPAFREGGGTIEGNLKAIHDGVRKLWLNDAKIFCVSEVGDEPLMWAHYAGDNTGVAIKIRCDEKIDNLLCGAKQVHYQTEPPLFLTLNEFVDSNFGGKPIDPQDYWDRVFYTKHTRWSYEREWRVVVPGEAPGKPHSQFPFRPEEISAVVLGPRIVELDRAAISKIVESKFPDTRLLQAKLNPGTYGIEIEEA